MASRVQQATNSNGTATTAYSVTISSSRKSSLIAVVIGQYSTGNTTIPTVTDNVGNIYTMAANHSAITGSLSTRVFYSANSIAGATTITITPGSRSSAVAAEYTGMAITNVVNAVVTAPLTNTTVTSWASNSIGTTSTTVLMGWVVSLSAANQGFAPSGAWSTVLDGPDTADNDDLFVEDQVNVNAGNYAAAGTNTSATVYSGIIAFNVQSNAGIPYKVGGALGALSATQASGLLVRTSTGNLYLVNAPGNTKNLFVYKSINNGVSWTVQDYKNSPSPPVAAINKITAAIDGNDVIHIAYDGPAAQATYVQFSTTTATFGRVEKVPMAHSAAPNSISIAVDSNNIPHIISCSAGTAATSYNNRIGNTWRTTSTTIVAANNNSLEIQIDNNNVPQIVYLSTLTTIVVVLGNKNNATSFTTTNLSANGGTSGGVGLAIDSLNNTWVVYTSGNTGRITLQKHFPTDSWTTWQAPIDNLRDGKMVSLATNGTDIYVFYERNLGGIAYDRYDSITSKWLGEVIIEPTTSSLTTNFRPHNPFVKWSNYFDNGSSGLNNQSSNIIEYLFDDGSTVYYDKLQTAQISTGLAQITFAPPAAGGTTTSTSSTSSSTSISTSSTSSSTSASTSISSTSTSTSISTSTSSTSTSISTSSTSVSTSTSTSSTSSSTSLSTSSTSTSISISTSTSSTSVSTSISTSSTSSSTSISSTSSSTSLSTSSTSSSISTSLSTSSTSHSTSISTSSTSSSVSTSTSSTSSSISTSSTSSSVSTSTSISSTSTSISTSTSSTSSSTSISTSSTSASTSLSTSSTSTSTSTSFSSTSTSTSLSTSSTSSSTSISTSSTSRSTSTSSTSSSTSISTSSTSQSTSTSLSTSSTSTSTTVSLTTSTSSTSSSTSTSSTSSSTSLSTSSTSTSISTSSTSNSTSISISSTSSSTSTSRSTSTSSTSQSTSTSISTSSTSTSTSISTSSTSTSTTISTTTSTSSTSTSISTSTSFSTSSTSTSTTTAATTISTSSTSLSTSSTSTSSTSTSTTLPLGADFNFKPRSIISPELQSVNINDDSLQTNLRVRLR